MSFWVCRIGGARPLRLFAKCKPLNVMLEVMMQSVIREEEVRRKVVWWPEQKAMSF
jgi:hypothetical protein